MSNNSEIDRAAVLNQGGGARIVASNQCGDFPLNLKKSFDPRCDVDAIAEYDKDVIAYVGARNWNKLKTKKDYTSNSQLKFSNIKTPGRTSLIDMKWWIDYTIKIEFTGFPYPSNLLNTGGSWTLDKSFLGKENMFSFRPFPLHQCTDNIHLRINNRDIISYPMQTLNQRMEYWSQERFKESCGFCPHRKPNCQTTYEQNYSSGRSPYMNIGSTYDGDYGNELIFGDITLDVKNEKNQAAAETYQTGIKQDSATNCSCTPQVTGIHLCGHGAPKAPIPWKYCYGSISLSIREPVMCEPLDYYSSKNGSRTMNNIDTIDLEYNFNNLNNMILFNRGTLYQMAKDYPVAALTELNGFKYGEINWYNLLLEKNLSDYMKVSIEEAELSFDVATPNIPSELPFVTDYVEYKRYETKMSTKIPASHVWNLKRNVPYSIDSDTYHLSYMPNAIYLWVAPNDASYTGTNMRSIHNNTYAQITKVEIDYGNLSNLCQQYDERDLFLMALRNGLEDRTYADWTRTNRAFNSKIEDYQSGENMITAVPDREFIGVGSVLRMIPGVDICSGGEVSLIGGMRISNESIKFKVQFRPLNMYDDIQYSLFCAFEYNGICTITPGFCDLALIHIDSYNQIAQATRAPRYRISRIYGKGLWGKVKNFARKANDFAKRTGVVSKVLKTIPFAPVNRIGDMAEKLGYGYPVRSTKMRGGMIIPPGSFYRRY